MGDVGMETAVSSEDPMTAAVCEIKVKGHLVQEWSEWLGDLRINYDDEGNTLLSGCIPDQAALHGILGADPRSGNIANFVIRSKG